MTDAGLPILMYHGLHAGAWQRGVFDAVYSVDPGDFSAQLDWLAHNGYRTILLRDLGAGTPLPPRSIVISFDDGDASNCEIALPCLIEHGMVAEFFMTTDFIGERGRPAAADLCALAAAGMGVQSHGCTHRYLDQLDTPELERELRVSKLLLEAIVGRAINAFALPGGRGGERERRAAAAAGYDHVLNSEPGRNAVWHAGEYLQRLAITRGMRLADFARLVQWHGLLPRAMWARYHALARAKRMLGNARYERYRQRVLRQ